MNYEAHYHAALENERAAWNAFYEALKTEGVAWEARVNTFRLTEACAPTAYDEAVAAWQAARDAHERASDARVTASAVLTFMYARTEAARDAYRASLR